MEKTRDISKIAYYELLQREYISADVRRKIYFKPSDKKYWKKICDYKKEKISSLSNEFELPSIFNCEETRLRLVKEFRNVGGIPLFQYKEDGSDKALERTDLLNYYKVDSDIWDTTSDKVGRIVATSDSQILDLGEVVVEVSSSKKIVKLQDIYRVL